jgi:hypothetical protein
MSEKNVIIILGMHRSGTSLIAKWMQAMGLDIGDDLLGTGVGNPKGHFEDRDFYELQKDILLRHGFSYLVQENQQITVNRSDKIYAQKLIGEKSGKNLWGWKDPRTALFVNEIWNDLVPGAKYIIVFRSPEGVIKSLSERQLKILKRKMLKPGQFFRSMLSYLNLTFFKNRFNQKILSSWVKHNAEIVKLIETIDRENYVCIEVSDLIEHDYQIYRKVVERFKVDFNYIPITKFLTKNNLSKFILGDSEDKKVNKIYHSLLKVKESFL